MVTKRASALGEKDIFIPRASNFFCRKLHVLGRHKLSLFYFNRFLGFGGFQQQVSLATEKGGDLQGVGPFGHSRVLRRFVYVCNNGLLEGCFYFFQNLQPCFKRQTAIGRGGSSAGFVVGSLENIVYIEGEADRLCLRSHFKAEVVTLYGAGAGKEH